MQNSLSKAGPATDIVKIIGGVKVVIYILGSFGGTSISRLMVYNVPTHVSFFSVTIGQSPYLSALDFGHSAV